MNFLDEDGKIGYHHTTKDSSADALSLTEVGIVGAKSNLLYRLHGAFMLAAWIGCAGTGMLVARYFKKTWVGTQSCGKDIWFAVSKNLAMKKKMPLPTILCCFSTIAGLWSSLGCWPMLGSLSFSSRLAAGTAQPIIHTPCLASSLQLSALFSPLLRHSVQCQARLAGHFSTGDTGLLGICLICLEVGNFLPCLGFNLFFPQL